MHINCCNANGPRAFALIPQFAYQVRGNVVNVNFYSPSEVGLVLENKRSVKLKQVTDYPVSGQVDIEVLPEKESTFAIALRIPAWSKTTSVMAGGQTQSDILPGAYYTIERKWKKGDKITLKLDLRARLVEQNQMLAIVRGPIVLARDSRFNDGFVDETSVIQAKDGYVDIVPVNDSSFAWMTFTAPMVLGAELESNNIVRKIHFCDFASAGNTWDKTQRYRVWLPQTLNVKHAPYVPYNVNN